jgi:DNA polymerase-1
MILRYNMVFSGMSTWRDGIILSALNNGAISTAIGRRLKVTKDSNVNSLINFPVQGTAADGFKLALINLDERLVGQDAQIVHILHDEVIVTVRQDIANDIAAIVKNCMEQAFIEIFPAVPFVVEMKIRNTWG